MRTSSALRIAVVAAAFGAGQVAAFEIKDLNDGTPPAEAFSYGLSQYKTGDKLTAIEALSFAASRGVTGAQWKLGNMYAEGDGVARDEIKAFELFSEIAAQADDEELSGERSAPFVSNAYVRLGTYYRNGIPNTNVKPDLGRARQYYDYAASIFGNADAQLNLARMYYGGEGGERDLAKAAKWASLSAEKGDAEAKQLLIDISLNLAQAHLDGQGAGRSPREAAKWARQAANNGSIEGQALLGHILFEGDGVSRQPIDGLTLLTIALVRSGSAERWIADMHEAARSAATEGEWIAAKVRADEWLAANPTQVAANPPK